MIHPRPTNILPELEDSLTLACHLNIMERLWRKKTVYFYHYTEWMKVIYNFLLVDFKRTELSTTVCRSPLLGSHWLLYILLINGNLFFKHDNSSFFIFKCEIYYNIISKININNAIIHAEKLRPIVKLSNVAITEGMVYLLDWYNQAKDNKCPPKTIASIPIIVFGVAMDSNKQLKYIVLVSKWYKILIFQLDYHYFGI